MDEHYILPSQAYPSRAEYRFIRGRNYSRFPELPHLSHNKHVRGSGVGCWSFLIITDLFPYWIQLVINHLSFPLGSLKCKDKNQCGFKEAFQALCISQKPKER